MYGKNNPFNWKKYLMDVEPIINRTYLIYGIFGLISTLVQYFYEYNDMKARFLNFFYGIICLLIYSFRKRIPVRFKVLFLSTLAFIGIFITQVVNGLLGTGFIQSVALLLTIIIFFRTRYALMMYALLLAIPGYLACGVITGRRIYSLEVLERMNSIGLWVPFLLNLAAIGLICIMAIDYFRREVFGQVTKLERFAHYDPLSGLPNRSYFFESMEEREKKKQLEKGGALLLINLKQFRITNMLLGPELADEILRLTGEVISGGILGEHDLACRLMGDEFLIWTDITDDVSLDVLKERILVNTRKAVKAEMSQEVNLNFAAAYYEGGRDHIQAAYSRVVLAMNRAKANGDGKLVFYCKKMKQGFEQESRLYEELSEAISAGEIEMFYHEQRSMDGEKVVGLESLARWKKKRGEYISPAVFVPLVNKYNLILPFGYLTMELVFRDLARLMEIYGPDISVSLNISPVLFLSTGFSDYLREQKEAFAVKDDVLVLELTEDIFVEDRELLARIFAELKDAGFRISLDDFGTGYSSLSYLGSIDFDEVKIDKSLVDNIDKDRKQLGVIEAICQLSGRMDFTIVAEGVEREEQMVRLREAGCHRVQGFLHSRPRPVEKLGLLGEVTLK